MSKEKEITEYYINYIIKVFLELNIDEKIDLIYYLNLKKNKNIRRLTTYKNNLEYDEYDKYYNKNICNWWNI